MTGAPGDPVARLNQPGKGPPCSHHLGMRALEADIDAGTVTLAFEARPEFGNPVGHVQGGFVTAMLDETAAIAAVVHSNWSVVVPSLEIKTCFLAPAPIGAFTGRGRVLKRGKSIAFLEADLYTADGTHCAHATITAQVRARPQRLNSVSSRPDPTGAPAPR